MTEFFASPGDSCTLLTPQLARTLFEQGPQAALLLDERARVVACNQAAAELLGYSQPQALLGYHPAELSPSQQPDGTASRAAAERFVAAALSGSRQRIEWVQQRNDGTPLWTEISLQPLNRSGQRLCHVLIHDISKRKTLERELQLRDQILTSTHDGIVITDTATRIVRVNEAFERITGYHQHEIRGHTPRLLKSGHHDEAFYQSMWQSIQAHGSWSGELWDRSKNGTLQPQWTTISRVTDAYGTITHYIGVFRDLTELRRSQQRLQHQAYHDTLTGLPNRTLFMDRLARALDRSRVAQHQLAVLFIDLDHFKDINDSLGHTAGDRILRHVAQRLQSLITPADTLARLSGDEFSLCIAEIHSAQEALTRAEAIHEQLSRPFQYQGQLFPCHCSIGISIHPDNGGNVEELMRSADSALHNAKGLSRNTTCFYASELTERAQRRLHVVQEVRHGLERGEFTPYFQRQVDLRSGATIGFESLARWQHPTRGLLAPGEFIPVAEEMGLMSALDQTILFQCCLQGRKWLDAGQSFGRVAVNLSAVDLQQDTFHREILQILEQTGLPSRCLELELTESAFMELRAATLTGLRQLRESGVKLTIDDFGTGYSSLLYLKRLPVDRLKIDKGFIWDMEGSPETRSIVQTIIELARVLGLETVAEGVETEAQRAQLQALGCTIGQGFLWGRPAPEPELELKPEPSPT